MTRNLLCVVVPPCSVLGKNHSDPWLISLKLLLKILQKDPSNTPSPILIKLPHNKDFFFYFLYILAREIQTPPGKRNRTMRNEPERPEKQMGKKRESHSVVSKYGIPRHIRKPCFLVHVPGSVVPARCWIYFL